MSVPNTASLAIAWHNVLHCLFFTILSFFRITSDIVFSGFDVLGPAEYSVDGEDTDGTACGSGRIDDTVKGGGTSETVGSGIKAPDEYTSESSDGSVDGAGDVIVVENPARVVCDGSRVDEID